MVSRTNQTPYAAPFSASVTAMLGPTNTGKTHYAIERMMGRSSGVIGLPLRLLAREVYDRVRAIKGDAACALITGEEKIVPPKAHYYVCTVEAMPTTQKFAFVAIDEVQLIAHPERGHVFTDRVLNMRGHDETLFLGASTARNVLRDLLPKIRFETRERFSTLSYSGEQKITRLPKRSVIVAFSTEDVYGIAELLRRFRGGAAVVMGALSPRTRNAQADLFQSGDVDFLVATDAVGMGLNLDTDHVAFASLTKFDGVRRRYLTPVEAGQIAGRAGRFRNHGTFGTTGNCAPMDPEMVTRIENHQFDDLRYAEWRNSDLRLQSVDALLDSLAARPTDRRLRRVALPTDELALERLLQLPDVKSTLGHRDQVALLWEVCQVPDFRNLTIDSHVRLLARLYKELLDYNGHLSEEYFSSRIARLDHVDGSVDTLSTRLAHIRTWTYCANKIQWTKHPQSWIKQTRDIEDRLSDALHDALTARFVDRRTNALLKGMTKVGLMTTTIRDDGDVWLDDHKIGRLVGLRFEADNSTTDLEAKALMSSAKENLGPEVNRRLTSLSAAQQAVFTLSQQGEIMWGAAAVGKVASGGTIFNPDVTLIGGEFGDPNLCALAESRMREYLKGEVMSKLECLDRLKALSEGGVEGSSADARGFAFQMLEMNGHIDRQDHGALVKNLERDARRELRDIGVVFGQYDVYMRDLVKPKPAQLLSLLVAYGAGGDKTPFVPFAGMTSIPCDAALNIEQYSKSAVFRAGYRVCGPRVIRFDILNRLAALIRQAQSEAGGRKFQIMQEMLALLGCTYEDMQGVLRALGYQSETIDVKDIPDVKAPDVKAPDDKSPKTIDPAAKSPDPEASEVKTRDVEANANVASETPLSNAPLSETPDPKGNKPVNGVTANVASSNVKPSDSPSPDKSTSTPAAKLSNAPARLSVFEHRDTGEDGEVLPRKNNEFWSMVFKSSARRGSRSDVHARRDKKGGDKGRYKGKKSGYNQDNKQGHSQGYSQGKGGRKPKREREPDADSPFAILASLKAPKSGESGGGKS